MRLTLLIYTSDLLFYLFVSFLQAILGGSLFGSLLTGIRIFDCELFQKAGWVCVLREHQVAWLEARTGGAVYSVLTFLFC